MRPRVQEFKKDDEFALSGVQYGFPLSFIAMAGNSLAENTIAKALSTRSNLEFQAQLDPTKPISQIGKPSPVATKDFIDDMQKDRPGLQIPEGVSTDVAHIMSKQYDDKRYYRWIGNHVAPTKMARASAFAGSVAGTLADIPALVVGEGAGVFAQGAFKATATKFAEHMGAKDIMGNGFARIGTALAEHAAKGGAAFGGFQATEEAAEQFQRRSMDEPYTWTESATRVGHAIKIGAEFGAVLNAAGFFADRSFGFLPDKTKNFLQKYYRPTSPDAEMVARVEGTSQMLNGNSPKVDDILHAGKLEESERLKGLMKQEGIDREELTQGMQSARVDLSNRVQMLDQATEMPKEIPELAERLRSQLQENPEVDVTSSDFAKFLDERFKANPEEIAQAFDVAPKAGVNTSKMISQQSMYDNMKLGRSPNLTVPDEIRDRIKQEIKIKELDQKINEIKEQIKDKAPGARTRLNKAQSLKQTYQNVLEGMPKPVKVEEEISALEQNLRPDGELKKGFRSTKDYQRLKDLSRISNKARNLLFDINLSHEKSLRSLYDQMRHTAMADALEKDMFAKSVLDHVNDGHEPIAQENMKEYADHIASRNVEPTEETLPDPEAQTLDQIKENFFDDQVVEDLLDAVPDDEMKAEYDDVTEQLGKMDKLRDMTRTITKCLLGGG